MSGKPLNKKSRKIAQKKAAKPTNEFIIAGSYKERQLAWIKKNGIYNYPVREGDEFNDDALRAVKELWLFADVKSTRHAFAVKGYVGKMTKQEFVAKYPSYKKPTHDAYYVFEVTKLDYEPTVNTEIVIARTADFGRRTAKIKKAIEQFKADGEYGPLAAYLPKQLSKVPPKQLRVSEVLQMSFLQLLDPPLFAVKTGSKSRTYKIASLFAGCGGLDLGFLGGFDFLGKKFAKTGFEIVWANELSPAACKTYERNIGEHIVCGDIKDVISSIPNGVDVVMGGFPCQDISINGKMQGIKGRRSCLYTYIVDAVKNLQPKVFVAENVGSLMLKQNEYSFKTILSDFQSLGYNVTYHVYHAEEYGVPQTRERIIFVGTRRDMPAFVYPKPIAAAPITAGEALRDLERQPQSKEFSHVWSEAAPSGEQGSRRMVEDRPGYTIRAECHGNIQFHYRLPRRISMREAARIQSFPDSFMFPCGIRETERQIGNAVPPVLAWHIASAVKTILDKADEQKRV